MRVLLWQGCQKLISVINVHTSHATLRGTQQMVIMGRHMDSLVDQNMEAVPGEGVVVTNCSGDILIGFRA